MTWQQWVLAVWFSLIGLNNVSNGKLSDGWRLWLTLLSAVMVALVVTI